MAESGSQIASNFGPILWISKPCPSRGYSHLITSPRKVSLTIDEEIYVAIDIASKTLNRAKSQLAQAGTAWMMLIGPFN